MTAIPTDVLVNRRRVVLTENDGTIIVPPFPVNLSEVGGSAYSLGQKALGGGNLPVVQPTDFFDNNFQVVDTVVNSGTNHSVTLSGLRIPFGFRGLAIATEVTAFPGAGAVAMVIRTSGGGVFSTSRQYINLGNITGVGSWLHIIHPDAIAANYTGASVTIFTNQVPLIQGSQIRVTITGGNWSYTMAASYMP